MNTFRPVFAIFASVILLVLPAAASDDPPSEESVHELLNLTNVRGVIDEMIGQMKAQMDQAMKMGLQGQELTPNQQDIVARMQSRVVDVVTEELDWERLEALYTEIYVEAFTGEEVEGMLAFYRTPIGQSTVRKMPVVMRKAMEHMQGRMGPMTQKLQKIQEDFVEELKADALRQELLKEETEPAPDGAE